MIEGYEVDQTYHEPVFPFDADRVREVKVIAFDDEDRILAVKKGRNFDLPAGWPEWDDDDAEDTARREAHEQANVILGTVSLAAVIEEAFEGMTEPPTYTLALTGKVQDIEEMPPERKHKRGFFKKEIFLKRYRFGNPEDVRTLIEMAEYAKQDREAHSKRENKRKSRKSH